jgi:hypothetical protein
MIILVTGIPGAGKTLYALNLAQARAVKEGRQVYYSGVRDLTLPWHLFGDEGARDKPWETDATKWYELPEGSIIFIDEAQRIFRPRGSGSQVPLSVSELETHRHKGYDIVLVTQHPMLIDSNIRRLVGQHFHVIRKWGGPKAIIAEWSSCTEVSRASIKDAVRHDFRYPVASFGWYKSAELHTHKRRIPMRVMLLWFLPVLIIGILWWAFRGGFSFLKKHEVAPLASSSTSSGSSSSSRPGRTMSTGEYVSLRTARIPLLPWTAPAYDKLTEPTRVPVPAACVKMADVCRCFTQDATPLDVEANMCATIVAHGLFLDFDPEVRKQNGQDQRQAIGGTPLGVQGAPGAPGAPVRAPGAPGGVLEVAGTGYSPVPLSAASTYDPVAFSSPRDNSGMNRSAPARVTVAH